MHLNISFCDDAQANAFHDTGWFIYPLLSENEIAFLMEAFHRFHHHGNEIPPFTLCSPDYYLKKETALFLKNYFIPKFDALFRFYRITGANFYYKAPHSSVNVVPPHQDWTFVDEKVSSSINIWIPLTDVNKENGAYHVIEGSHRWEFTYRGSNIPSACKGMQYNFDDLKYIPLSKGEAIIYDHRLIHATPPNVSGSARIAIVLNALPLDAQLIHCIQPDRNSNAIDIYEVDEEFYWKYTFSFVQNTMPPGYKKIKSEWYVAPDYSRTCRFSG
ncbi:MAG TPA: phytanoyl-CoA dioxygenase family protein [Chitinophagales bacterium]|nr:phytanoyl-CoA dioxygenase family protein [Chitinophagales bacterium]